MKNRVGTRACPSQAAGDACPICLEKVFAGVDAVIPPCGHTLHENCAVAVASTGSLRDAAIFTCPVCREQCPYDNLTSAHRGDPLPGSRAAERNKRIYRYSKAAESLERVLLIKKKAPSIRADATACILSHRKKWRQIHIDVAGDAAHGGACLCTNHQI